MARHKKKCFNCTYLRNDKKLTDLECLPNDFIFHAVETNENGAIIRLDNDGEANNCNLYDGDNISPNAYKGKQ